MSIQFKRFILDNQIIEINCTRNLITFSFIHLILSEI